MTQQNVLSGPARRAPLGKRMLQGAGIGLILISLFLLKAGEPKPEWGNLWQIKPLIMVPIAGAMGGAFYYLLAPFRAKGSWQMALGILIGLIGFLFALWIGTVLGLNGTYWD